MKEIIMALDIGGTSIKIGMIYDTGEIFKKWEIPTDKSNTGVSIVDDIWTSISDNLKELKINSNDLLGIGVGAPGFIDSDNGFVYEAVNIGWKDFDLAKQLKDKSGLPVFVENDANIAVLGENWKGAGNQSRNVIALTIGTGVGGGIIANGSILNGVNGVAGEIGHITVDPNGDTCNCGSKGCLETIASATGLVRQAMASLEQKPHSILADYYKQEGTVSAKDIFELASNGDSDCKHIINKTGDILGMVIANMGVTLNPSKVLIGGGVSKAGDQLLNEIKKAFHQYALPRVSKVCEIKTAELGNDAGIIGGAFLVRQKLRGIKF
ncbi:glucokinase [Virgibacillus natechei]|uniref:Glucokinase n=1 Tax=Virgibacillus natechei TaxID=1216297 RepID=A0ABS4IMH4_9BACI|nr:ROK family glucokinase [Virgibacillus natechei]MBP1971765.1 glucokinase [Virgibacillus natechei]